MKLVFARMSCTSVIVGILMITSRSSSVTRRSQRNAPTGKTGARHLRHPPGPSILVISSAACPISFRDRRHMQAFCNTDTTAAPIAGRSPDAALAQPDILPHQGRSNGRSTHRVLGVNRREDQVPGDRRLHAHAGGLGVAHFADQNHVLDPAGNASQKLRKAGLLAFINGIWTPQPGFRLGLRSSRHCAACTSMLRISE